MFFRTTWSASSFPPGMLLGCPLTHFLAQQRCRFPASGLPWKTLGIICQSTGPQLRRWGRQTGGFIAGQTVRSSLLLEGPAVAGGKCPASSPTPSPCLAELHRKHRSFVHLSSATRCVESCHLIIVEPLMILISCGLCSFLVFLILLGLVSQKIFPSETETIVYHMLKFLYGIIMRCSSYE